MRNPKTYLSVAVAAFFSIVSLPSSAQEITMDWLEAHYAKREVMIPMRDGVELSTVIYEPVDSASRKPLTGRPIMMERTPYGIAPYGERFSGALTRSLAAYVRDRYIYVEQSVRGTFLSGGRYRNIRPLIDESEPLRDPAAHVDEATDMYDTAEWLVRNTGCNGNIGVKGTSYPGFYAAMAGLSGHPAVKAVSPQAPVTDWFMGDDAHHNGAYFLADEYGFNAFYRHRPAPTTEWPEPYVDIEGDLYEWYLGKPMADLMAAVTDSLEFTREVSEHPDYDSYWRERDASQYLRNIPCAVMVVGGWFDAEDCYGALRMYQSAKALSPGTDLFLVEGPWYHGGWSDEGFHGLGGAYFGEEISEYYIENIEFPFFDHYLDGGPVPAMSRVMVYPSSAIAVPESLADAETALYKAYDKMQEMVEKAGIMKVWEESGSDAELSRRQKKTLEKAEALLMEKSMERRAVAADYVWNDRWKGFDSWPPKNVSPVVVGLSGDGTLAGGGSRQASALGLSTAGPDGSSAGRSYVSDPASPVPYYGEPTSHRNADYMASDQKFASGRSDVLTYSGGEVADTLVLAGPVGVHLEASCTGTDCDFIVKLIDVRPDGCQMLVRGDVMPARFRESFEHPSAIVPGEKFTVDYTMNDVFHIVLPGHRLMVQVQSSWFPLVAMNPQTFLENPYHAEAADYRKASITVFPASSVTVPVME